MSTPYPPPTEAPPVSITTFIAHRRMVLCLAASTLIVGLYLSHNLQTIDPPPSLLKAVALAGAIGGFVSALRRFYSFDGAVPAPPVVRIFGKSYLYVFVYSLIPPLIGAIGAVVVYVVFAAGLVKSAAFPLFDHVVDPQQATLTHFTDFIYNWKPKTEEDYAKAFVWAFVAGFSERFVPDLLGKLTAESEK